jgi:hypothetical protein
MSGFSVTELKVSSSDGHNFVLLEAFTYTTKDGTVIEVPVGTTSDGASTPKTLWSTIPPFGTYWMAAYLHDYLYRNSKYPKNFCDNVLYEAMCTLMVPAYEAKVIYEGVALAGQYSFDKDRQ